MGRRMKGQNDFKDLIGNGMQLALMGAMLLVAAGCGSADNRPAVYQTTGKISFKGAAPAGAVVALHPKDQAALEGRSVVPSGLVKPDGSFDLTSFAPSDGAPPGDYVLTVEWHKTSSGSEENRVLSPNLLPVQYSKPQTSPVVVTIAEQPNELKTIVIK
jgi:hypothetical protein